MTKNYIVVRRGANGEDVRVGSVDAQSGEEAVFRLVGGEWGRNDFYATTRESIDRMKAERARAIADFL